MAENSVDCGVSYDHPEDFTFSHEGTKAFSELITNEMIQKDLGERPSFVRFMQDAPNRLRKEIDGKIVVREDEERYELEVAAVAELIIMEELPLNFAATTSFVRFMRAAANPWYKEIERKVVIGEAKKRHEKLEKVLFSTFASLSRKVAVACDCWYNVSETYYCRITAHWIDDDWSMQRRLIGYKFLPSSASGVSECILGTLDEWGIKEMVHSVTFDDDCDPTKVKEDLKNVEGPILDGKVFHVRCACRALISCVEAGWELVCDHNYLDRIVQFRGYSSSETWRKTFEDVGEEYAKSIIMETDDWDTREEMLKHRLQYKDVITEFIASNWPGDASAAISEQDWELASIYCRILGVFSEAVDCISRNYYPSSCGILLHLVNIAKVFTEYRGNVVYKEKAYVVEETFLKHFDKIPDLYSLAAVMDPRIKLSGCECLLESFYQFTDNMKVNVDEEKARFSRLLREMYDTYASQLSNGQPSSSEPSESMSTSSFAWSLIGRKKQKAADSAFNELTFYLEAPHKVLENENDEFDILTWWKNHEVIYPVLATMARDLLTTPVSTLGPDCAYSITDGTRIRGPGFTLKGTTLEVYSCLRDWLHAERRTQGERVRYVQPDSEDSEDDIGSCEG